MDYPCRWTCCLVLLATLTACYGDSALDRAAQDPVDPPVHTPAIPPPPSGPAFSLPTDQVALLPFRVRLAKLSAVAGVDTSHELLKPIRDSAVDLGDYDFANGIRADTAWNSSRMALWVRGLRPLCNSTVFKERYPALPDQLDALVLAAFGRRATAEDHTRFAEALGGAQPLDAAEKHLLTCLTVLSSLEFVSR